jgi:hypothetical protein
MKLDHGQINGQQDAAADISISITEGRNLISFLFWGDLCQKSVIKDVGARESQRAQKDEQGSPEPIPFANRDHQEGRSGSQESEKPQKAFFLVGDIGNGPEQGREEHNHDQ